jgi:hypothetical protein
MNLIGENNYIQFIGSTPGIILTLLCLILSIFVFATMLINMEAGDND